MLEMLCLNLALQLQLLLQLQLQLQVHESFTAIQEGKAAPSVDNNFFLMNVPVKQHASAVLTCTFPRANRHGMPPTRDALREALTRVSSGAGGPTMADCLADFQVREEERESVDSQSTRGQCKVAAMEQGPSTSEPV